MNGKCTVFKLCACKTKRKEDRIDLNEHVDLVD